MHAAIYLFIYFYIKVIVLCATDVYTKPHLRDFMVCELSVIYFFESETMSVFW